MKNSKLHAKRLKSLLEELRDQFEIPEPEHVDSVTQIVIGFLMWEATSLQADETFAAIRDEFVDLNEVRACLPTELASFIGRSYPRAFERCDRLSAVLNDVFRREDALDLSRLSGRHPSEIESYLASLKGMTPYVSGQVMLLCFNMPRLPVDQQLRTALIEDEAVDPNADLLEVQAWCSRNIENATMIDAHLLLQGWVEEINERRKAARRSRTRRKATSKVKRS